MTITRVQGPARGTTTGNSIPVTMGAAPTNGNVLIAVIGLNKDGGGAITVSSITQTGVNWSKVVGYNNAATYGDAEIWFGVVGSGASTTATIALSTSTGNNGGVANISEYSGVATSNYTDKTSTNYGNSGTSVDTGTTATTTQADELWIGAYGGDFSAIYHVLSSPSNGFTLLDGAGLGIADGLYGYVEKIVSAIGTADCSCSTTNAVDGWAGCIATFFASAGATNVSVTDSIGASDSVLSNKTLTVAEYVGVSDLVLCNKPVVVVDSLGAVDSAGLFDPAIFDPAVFDTSTNAFVYRNKTLAVADSVGALDSVLGNKSLIVSDVVSLSELINIITGAIIKTVADAIGISDIALVNKTAVIADAVSVLDQVFRHKPSVAVADVVAAAEAVLVSKLLMAADSVSLADVAKVLKTLNVSDTLSLVDAVGVPSRLLRVLDGVGLADGAFVNKALQVTDAICLVEVVWAGKRRETALYLVVGNLVVNLKTGKVDFAL
jgi:hypothetical protein